MKSPIEYDDRYKVNQKLVNEMRKLRKNTKLSYEKIGEMLGVSAGIVNYWTNDKSRASQQKKNAKRRRTAEEQPKATKRQHAKRRKRWKELPKTRIECDYWSMKTEKRSKRHKSKGRTWEEVKKEYEKTKAKTNQKVF